VRGREIVLATRSAGKLRELRQIFRGSGYTVKDLEEAGVPPSGEEDALEAADTFEENAAAKARFFYSRLGFPVVADDSGLEVYALGGRPGVRSKRWSERPDLQGRALDAANNARLVKELTHVTDRRARYVCVACYVDDFGELTRRGEVEGAIVAEPRGTGGFGYGVTFGEAAAEAKEGVSHRGRAFRALLSALGERG
jgi:XTP/dITP diphosphohydrolase